MAPVDVGPEIDALPGHQDRNELAFFYLQQWIDGRLTSADLARRARELLRDEAREYALQSYLLEATQPGVAA